MTFSPYTPPRSPVKDLIPLPRESSFLHWTRVLAIILNLALASYPLFLLITPYPFGLATLLIWLAATVIGLLNAAALYWRNKQTLSWPATLVSVFAFLFGSAMILLVPPKVGTDLEMAFRYTTLALLTMPTALAVAVITATRRARRASHAKARA